MLNSRLRNPTPNLRPWLVALVVIEALQLLADLLY